MTGHAAGHATGRARIAAAIGVPAALVLASAAAVTVALAPRGGSGSRPGMSLPAPDGSTSLLVETRAGSEGRHADIGELLAMAGGEETRGEGCQAEVAQDGVPPSPQDEAGQPGMADDGATGDVADGGTDAVPDSGEATGAPSVPQDASAPLDGPVASVVTATCMRDSFCHGELPAERVGYIVMHDTESGTDDAMAIARSWGSGHVAAHFVVGKDGLVVQCVPISQIAHHAGNADCGSNEAFGIWAERDAEVGRTGEGDYAMNAWSVGIEMVHEHDDGPYPEAQLEALDRLVAAIDAEVGHAPAIIDHKAWAGWRKQDCSDDFPLEAYCRARRHDGMGR